MSFALIFKIRLSVFACGVAAVLALCGFFTPAPAGAVNFWPGSPRVEPSSVLYGAPGAVTWACAYADQTKLWINYNPLTFSGNQAIAYQFAPGALGPWLGLGTHHIAALYPNTTFYVMCVDFGDGDLFGSAHYTWGYTSPTVSPPPTPPDIVANYCIGNACTFGWSGGANGTDRYYARIQASGSTPAPNCAAIGGGWSQHPNGPCVADAVPAGVGTLTNLVRGGTYSFWIHGASPYHVNYNQQTNASIIVLDTPSVSGSCSSSSACSATIAAVSNAERYPARASGPGLTNDAACAAKVGAGWTYHTGASHCVNDTNTAQTINLTGLTPSSEYRVWAHAWRQGVAGQSWSDIGSVTFTTGSAGPTDLCPQADRPGVQTSYPTGANPPNSCTCPTNTTYNSATNSCDAVAPTDLCPLLTGTQTSYPLGSNPPNSCTCPANSSYNSTTNTCVPDLCTDIPSHQVATPPGCQTPAGGVPGSCVQAGYWWNAGAGQCQPTDLCTNIPGVQTSYPSGSSPANSCTCPANSSYNSTTNTCVPDLCTDIPSHQVATPPGCQTPAGGVPGSCVQAGYWWNAGAGQCQPTDLCTNIPGVQTSYPSGSSPANSCTCPAGTAYNQTTNACQATVVCPAGATGTYPNCICPSGQTYNSATNSCDAVAPTDLCPLLTGTQTSYPLGSNPPNSCTCPAGTAYNPAGNLCQSVAGTSLIFGAQQNPIAPGTPATLEWTTTGMSQCFLGSGTPEFGGTVSGGNLVSGGTPVALSGSRTTNALTAPATYYMRCTATAGGTQFDRETVTLAAADLCPNNSTHPGVQTSYPNGAVPANSCSCPNGTYYNSSINACRPDICIDIPNTPSVQFTAPPAPCVTPPGPAGTPGLCVPTGYSWDIGSSTCVPNMTLNQLVAAPARVRSGGSTTLTWTGSGLPASGCSVTRSGWPGGPVAVSSGSSVGSLNGNVAANNIVRNITQQTVFTLACPGLPARQVIVSILPTFQEL